MEKAPGRGPGVAPGALLSRGVVNGGSHTGRPQRSTLRQQVFLLLPSVLLLLGAFLSPHLLLLARRGSASAAQNGTVSSGFSAALSLRFPTALATDDTLTAGAEALESLMDSASVVSFQDSNGTSSSNSSSSGGGGARPGALAEEEDPVVKAPVVDVDMQGLSAAAAAKRRARQEQLISQHTRCTCFKIKNNFCCSQSLCVCGPLCWNGQELVAQVKHGSAEVECWAPMDAAKAKEILVDSDVLRHIKCHERVETEPGVKAKPLAVVLEEGGFKDMGKRDLGWLADRRHTATWRLGGATFLRLLDVRAASDASAFASRLFPLLLMNNASVRSAMRKPWLSHVLLPRDRFFRGVAEEHGPDGLLAHLLELLLRAVLEPLKLGSGGFVLPEWHRQRVVRDEVDPSEEQVLGGSTAGSGAAIREQKHVEYERAWDAATEAAPLCMEHAILPGTLKGLVYPNNTDQAEAFKAQALRFLSLQPEPAPTEAGRVRLLFARRADVSDRVLEAASEQALMALFGELGFARIEVLDLSPVSQGSPLTLPRLVQAVQNADVIVGLHCSALLHAGTFLRPGTVVLEIVPHHLFFSDVQVLVAASGGLFIQHMLLPSQAPPPGPSASRGSGATSALPALDASGNPQWDNIDFKYWDDEYSKHTVAQCMDSRLNIKCRQYFMRDRPIMLSPDDAGELLGLLGLAKHFAEKAMTQGLSQAREELARQSLSVCKSGYRDLGFVATDWLYEPSLPIPLCILKRTYWREKS